MAGIKTSMPSLQGSTPPVPKNTLFTPARSNQKLKKPNVDDEESDYD